MIKLHITPPQDEPFEFELEGDEVVIGRSMKSDLSISDRFLSRQHARMFRTDDGWLIEDLGSRNGTFVNGSRVNEASPVRPGDMISMSASIIRVYEEGQEVVPAAAADPVGGRSVFRPATELLAMSTHLPPPSEDPAGTTIRRQAERLSILNEVHQALAESIALDELLDLILERTFDHLRPKQGAVFLKDDSGQLFCAASHPPDGTEFTLSQSLCREVVEKGMAALVHDIRDDERFMEAVSLLDHGVRSLIAAPLAHSKGVLGMIVLSSTADMRIFTEGDMDLLTSLASVAALRIRNLALTEEAAERRRLQHEVALARQIQLALIPDHMPEVEGYETFGVNFPSQGVSGDYFEVIERLDGREIILFVADVSGKGISASLLTAYIEALSTAPIEDGLEPDEVFNRVSRHLYSRTPHERFATAFLASLDPSSATVRYANAGHNPPLVLRKDDTVEWLGSTGIPLGLLPMAEYESGELTLAPGETLVMYTDGITEAINPEEEEFDSTGLEAVCRDHRERPLPELADFIDRALEDFAQGVPFADDRTLVMLRRV
jgi:serine phosphatase RsbU (regulator of sigma subunit)/pSer/pThr/pTyr-binding forkhead associated (FHA) protein